MTRAWATIAEKLRTNAAREVWTGRCHLLTVDSENDLSLINSYSTSMASHRVENCASDHRFRGFPGAGIAFTLPEMRRLPGVLRSKDPALTHITVAENVLPPILEVLGASLSTGVRS